MMNRYLRKSAMSSTLLIDKKKAIVFARTSSFSLNARKHVEVGANCESKHNKGFLSEKNEPVNEKMDKMRFFVATWR
ncbi:MAG: hypothetical protein CSA81_13285, partial [Acidobacteria bacterium]